jgi:hypothetical protein
MLSTILFRVLSTRCLSKNLNIKIQKTIILPVALYGCETWSLTLMGEHRLRVFLKRVLGRIFGPKREEVAGDRRLHDEGLNNFYASPNIIRVIKSRRMKWKRQVARMREMRNSYTILVGKRREKTTRKT